ncbi:MAG TPA: ROK family protein [Syntrophorhabdales bacterium]|nr:ROK family protein [Syntrophorhabdales bacterium]
MRIGIDIGGTKIAVGLISESGQVTKRRKVKTDAHKGYPGVRDQIRGLVAALLSEAGAGATDVGRIGIACAGQIDHATGKILFSPNLNWTDAPLKHDVEEATGIQTFIENDVNAGTYGEWRFGFHREASNVVGIFIGTGVGGGLILNGRLFRGSHGVGGELGHTTLNPFGYQCRCGNRGCFEAYCGGSYIEERVRQRLMQGYRGKLWDIVEGRAGSVHVGRIEEAYLLGDDLCTEIWGEVVEYLGAGLQSVANLINPDLIIFGGGVVKGTQRLIDEALLVMKRRAMRASIAGLKIERARLGDDATLLGAAFVKDE